MIDADSVTLATANANTTTVTRSGLMTSSDGLSLIQGCTDGQLLEWTDASGWACANDDSGGSIGADSLDFIDFEDVLDLDATTEINLGANAFTIDMDSTGDFSIRDGSTDIALFNDSGAITLTPSSNQNLTATLSGTGIFNVTAGQSLLGGSTLSTGTLAKLNIVSSMSSSGSTTAIAGIHGEYTIDPSAGGTQIGNRFVINNAPTSVANTVVNTIVRSIDNTSLANTVRGLEIVSNAGSNTAGTNTGVRTTGATFGVQAFTSGLAASAAAPAAVYAESTGTTQGDVLRLYSTSLTSAPSFATFYHSTSTFTGTGLLMDMATGSGTFSGNFIDLQNNNTSKFTVKNDGSTGIGDATPDYMLDVNGDVADYIASFFNDGNATTRSGILIQAGLDNQASAGPSTLIGFKDGDGDPVGSITFGSSVTAYNTTSDMRLKENVVDTILSLDLLNQVKIHDYTWIADSEHKLAHGVLAQELYQVYPGAVTKPADETKDYWMVDYSKLMPLAIKSIQDLAIDLEAQKVKISGLSFADDRTSFTGAVSFGNTVEFTVPPMFNKDTAGFAVIKEGTRKVEVVFDAPYIATPVVNTTISYEDTDNVTEDNVDSYFADDIKSLVINKTKNGFTIIINKNAPRDVKFSWNALQVKDAKIFESVIPGLIIENENPAPQTDGNTNSDAGSNTDSVTPTGDTATTTDSTSESVQTNTEQNVEPAPSPEPTPEQIVNPEPAPTQEPTPEPAPTPTE